MGPVLAPARGKRKTSLPRIKIKEVLVALSRMFNKWTPVLGLLTSTRAAVKVVTRSFEGKKKKKKKKKKKGNEKKKKIGTVTVRFTTEKETAYNLSETNLQLIFGEFNMNLER